MDCLVCCDFPKCVQKCYHTKVREFILSHSSILNAFLTAIVFGTLTDNKTPDAVKNLDNKL